MATGELDFRLQDAGWLDQINDTIADLGQRPIEGGLTVDGHDYWVILEYGSSPASPTPGPTPGDVVPLNPPADVPPSKEWGEPYPITPRERKFLKFFHDGQQFFSLGVKHPGNVPRMHIRQIIDRYEEKFQQYLEGIFDSHDDTLPERRELVAAFNGFLRAIRTDVKADTPVGEFDNEGFERDNHDGHLRDAWGLQLAT